MDKYIFFKGDKNEEITHDAISKEINGEALCWYVYKEDNINIKVYYYKKNEYNILDKELLVDYVVETEEYDFSKMPINKDRYIKNTDGIYDCICIFRIEELSEYIRIINILTESTDYVYRGQADKERKLKASIFRKNYSEEKEYNIFKEIKRNRLREFESKDFLDNLVHMQHYGIPTRLLDWSKNPLIPLFFGCLKNNNNNDGKVFMYKPNIIHEFDGDEYGRISNYLKEDLNGKNLSDGSKGLLVDVVRKAIPKMIFINSTYENDRVRAQSGLFSINMEVKEKYIDDIKKEIIKSTKLGKELKEIAINKIISEDNVEDIFNFIKGIPKELLTENNRNRFDDEEINDFISELKKTNYFNGGKDYNSYKDIDPDIISFIILDKSKKKILSELEKVNINSMTVYPDLNGFVEYIKGKYEKE